MGTFVTTDCSTDCDMSHIVASPASRMLGATTWWYEVERPTSLFDASFI